MASRRMGYDRYDPDAEAETVWPAEAAAMRRRCEADDATWMTTDNGEGAVLRYVVPVTGVDEATHE